MSDTRPTTSYDLHLHTYWSYDACACPATYFRAAAARGLRCIAVTEHHVLDFQPELERLKREFPDVRCLRAGEFTVNTSLGSVDLVCLGFPPETPADIQAVLDQYHQWQRAYGAAICRGMQAIGCNYTDQHRRELLRDYRPAKTLRVQGDTHVRNQMQRAYFLRRRLAASAEEYADLMKRAKAAGAAPPYPEARDVVPVFKAHGVLIAIAHPHGPCAGADLDRLETLRKECQLDGVECAHSTMPAELIPVFRSYCEERGLFSSAGSDCHHDYEIETLFTRHGGAEEWLDELLERLPAHAAL